MAPAWLTVIAWLYLSACFCCASIIAYDIAVNHRRRARPSRPGQRRRDQTMSMR